VTDEREVAAAEAHEAQNAASAAVNRPRVYVWDNATEQLAGDITEDVVTVVDGLVGSLDWGSGWMTEEEVDAVRRIAKLLRFEGARWHEFDYPYEPHPYRPPPPNLCVACGHNLDEGRCGYARIGDDGYCHASDHSCYEQAVRARGWTPPLGELL
jgi:hypothetical protein